MPRLLAPFSLRWKHTIPVVVFALGLLAANGWARSPAPTVLQSQDAQSDVDLAYVNGYKAGYEAGQSDHVAGLAANPHKFRSYQVADGGYSKTYGARTAYQRGYRSGFDDGYGDGYSGRPRSLGPAPAAAAEPAEAPAAPPAPASAATPATPPTPGADAAEGDAAKKATAVGYREGYSAGQFDANRGAPYNFAQNAEYKLASAGYDNSRGEFAAYQTHFRDGFQQGYDDGFNHRLYNSQIGLRSDTGSTAPSGPGILPTNPEVARARPSGVYGNGILVEEGTLLQARLNTNISTKFSRQGDPFTATVTVPVWVGATLAIPAGSTLKGTVAQVQRGGAFHGGAQLQLQYDSLEVPGSGDYTLHATTAGVGQGGNVVKGDEGSVQQPNQTGQNVKRVATGTGLGAIIGAIAGGGRGAMIGGILGATVGTAGVMTSRHRDIDLHTGEDFAVKLDRPLELRSTASTSQP